MPEYAVGEVIKAVRGRPSGEAGGVIREVLTDSRRIIYPEGALHSQLR